MKDKKWRVGDRVEYRKADGAPGSSMLNGCRGTVVYIDGQEASCTVQFDDIVPLGVTETRGGLYEKNCWYCRPDSLIGVPGRPPVKEKEGKGRKKREAGASPRPTEERGSGAAGASPRPTEERESGAAGASPRTTEERESGAHFESDLGGFNEAYWMADVFPTREAAEKRLEELKS